jgi:hypothetical protein
MTTGNRLWFHDINYCFYFQDSVHLLTSSGQMINLKLSRSSGSGNSVPQVFGRLSSFISKKITLDEREQERKRER